MNANLEDVRWAKFARAPGWEASSWLPMLRSGLDLFVSVASADQTVGKLSQSRSIFDLFDVRIRLNRSLNFNAELIVAQEVGAFELRGIIGRIQIYKDNLLEKSVNNLRLAAGGKWKRLEPWPRDPASEYQLKFKGLPIVQVETNLGEILETVDVIIDQTWSVEPETEWQPQSR